MRELEKEIELYRNTKKKILTIIKLNYTKETNTVSIYLFDSENKKDRHIYRLVLNFPYNYPFLGPFTRVFKLTAKPGENFSIQHPNFIAFNDGSYVSPYLESMWQENDSIIDIVIRFLNLLKNPEISNRDIIGQDLQSRKRLENANDYTKQALLDLACIRKIPKSSKLSKEMLITELIKNGEIFKDTPVKKGLSKLFSWPNKKPIVINPNLLRLRETTNLIVNSKDGKKLCEIPVTGATKIYEIRESCLWNYQSLHRNIHTKKFIWNNKIIQDESKTLCELNYIKGIPLILNQQRSRLNYGINIKL
jgi:ubiquitin-protein ligase